VGLDGGTPVAPHQVEWRVGEWARPALDEVKGLCGPQDYEWHKNGLKELLCAYFSGVGCTKKLGKSISPVGATANGERALKVRWALPGQGKSGGLRLLVTTDCSRRRVRIAHAFFKADDPSDWTALARTVGA
jgi:hypothetical protein